MSKTTLSFSAPSHSFSPRFLFPNCDFLDFHALKPRLLLDMFWGYLHWGKIIVVITAWDVFDSWLVSGVWVSCLGFPVIWKAVILRAIAAYQMFCQLLSVMFSGEEVFRKLPVQLLHWKVILTHYFFGQTASGLFWTNCVCLSINSLKIVISYLELIKHIS